MIQALLLLFLLQWLGDVAATAFGLPVPGMVLGLAGLSGLIALNAHRHGAAAAVPPELDTLARFLRGYLGLLFVPAGVGILAHGALLADEGGAILAAVLASTGIGIAVTAVIVAVRARIAAGQAVR